jgi:hypothetical protein
MMRKISLAVCLLFLLSMPLGCKMFQPQRFPPEIQACGISFKLLDCSYNERDMTANVDIALVSGEVSGFNGRIRGKDSSNVVEGLIAERSMITMKSGETKMHHFSYNITSSNPKVGYRIEIDPLDNNSEICLSGASINCD